MSSRLVRRVRDLQKDLETIIVSPDTTSWVVASKSTLGFFFRHMASSQRPKDGLYKFYDVQHVLGRGAYATVVKALHRNEGKWYAIKLFSGDRLRELLTSATFRGAEERMKATAKHLRREVQALRGLSHPYVCELKEAFFEGYSVSE